MTLAGYRHVLNASGVVVGAILFCQGHAAAQTDVVATSSSVTISLPTGTPIHVRVTKTASMLKGAAVRGILTESVYSDARLVLPRGTTVRGQVESLTRVEPRIQTQALLNGDVTPLHNAVINFNVAELGQQTIMLNSEATMRKSQRVSFVAGRRRGSLWALAKSMAQERVRSTRDMIFGPDKKNRLLRLVYGQLPYHPQRIWSGSDFVADLRSPAQFELEIEAPPTRVSQLTSSLDDVVVSARLTSDLSSDSAKKGDLVEAVVTEPVFTPDLELLIGEGAKLQGSVISSKRSRSFGRNGQLRFVFRSVQRSDEAAEQIHGAMTAADGDAGQNISIDSEGGAKSNPDQNRFVAPLVLGLLAVAGHDRDRDGSGIGRDTVASNGFGLVARVLALAINDRNVATGFGAFAFAKSIYFRLLARGHPLTFPRDTLIDVQIRSR